MTPVEEARIDLSLAIAEKPYLGKWFSGDDLSRVKAWNRETEQRARQLLKEHANGGTIYYYRDVPSAGNKFRRGNICHLTGLPFAAVRRRTVEERRRIADGMLHLEQFHISRKDR